jgi:hypothetical protein
MIRPPSTRGPTIVKTTPQRNRARKTPSRRASPEVVEKRRAARAFNEALLGGGAALVDGRTERRRRRLLEELSQGTARGGKRELKPIEVLSRVQELLDLGEPLASIRKACPRPRPVEATPEIVEGIRRIHEAYTFPAAAYRFVGLDSKALREAGVLDPKREVARKTASSSSSSSTPPRAEARARAGRRATKAPPVKARRRGAA